MIGLWLPLVLAPARAAMPPILAQAVARNRAEAEHWAYTETIRVTDERGREQGVTILRVDPSLPYPEQYRPLQVGGHAPKAADLKEFRQLGEKIGRERADRPADAPPEIEVNGMTATILLDAARLVAEDARDWVYRLPLATSASSALPVQKLELLLRISKATRGYDSATLRLTAPWRTHIVVLVRQGQLDLQWGVIDPARSPLMVEEHGTLAASILFVHLGGWTKVTRTDFKRVTPYADRFGVKLGPLRVLPF